MKQKGLKTKITVGEASLTVAISKEVAWNGKRWKNHSSICFWESGRGLGMTRRFKARQTIKAAWEAALKLPTFGRPIYIEGTTEKRFRVYCALLKRSKIPFEIWEHKYFPELNYLRIEAKDWPGN